MTKQERPSSLFKQKKYEKPKEPKKRDILDKIVDAIYPHYKRLKSKISNPMNSIEFLLWFTVLILSFLNTIEMVFQLSFLFIFALMNLYYLLAYRKLARRVKQLE